VYRDGVERNCGSTDSRCGAAHAWCAKSGCPAGEHRRHVHDAWNADARASAEYIATAVGADASSGRYISAAVDSGTGASQHISAAIHADAGFELDAAADGCSEPAKLCEQRARYREREPGASRYAD
jgi:hypothetical protein